MDFVTLIIFLALYYLRPQEWLPAFSTIRPVLLLSGLALVGMVQSRRLNPRELVRTPVDYLIVAYFIWTLIAGFQFLHTLAVIEAVLLFYFVAARSLDTIPRQRLFLAWWCGFILLIAALAIASLYGFDPLNSNDKTQGVMKGRLILNLSVFDNPNALAHGIIPAVPLVYFLCFWRRTFMKVGLLLMAIPLWAIFLTQSKGAFLSCFATLLATLTFGRSKVWQIVILILAVGFGYGALYTLPRMHELEHSKTDPAIQGRVAAMTFGLNLMRQNWFGIGIGNFESQFFEYGPLEKHEYLRSLPPKTIVLEDGTREEEARAERVPVWEHYSKATHGSYNENGAELGYMGLFLFVSILYCCIRTLVLMKCTNNAEERMRRALFAMVVAYAVSSWMVDFCYRPTFFLFVAAISALQRYLTRHREETVHAIEEKPAGLLPPWVRRLQPAALAGISIPGLGSPAAAAVPSLAPRAATPPLQPAPLPPLAPAPAPAPGRRWLPWHPNPVTQDSERKSPLIDRLTLFDFAMMLFLTYLAIRYWEYLIATM